MHTFENHFKCPFSGMIAITYSPSRYTITLCNKPQATPDGLTSTPRSVERERLLLLPLLRVHEVNLHPKVHIIQ